MSLETGTYISDLVATNPTSTDLKSEGDNHLRLLKSTVKATFPSITGALTSTHTELNYVTGVTSAIQTQLNLKANLASPTFTGTPLAPTAIVGTNTTQLATTAHVYASVSALPSGTLPTLTGNTLKFLQVNAGGTAVAWATINTNALGTNSSSQNSATGAGAGALALGGSYASGTDSFAAAIGNNASTYGAQGANSIAIGQQSKATGANSIVLGNSSESTASSSVALGCGGISGNNGKLVHTSSYSTSRGDSQYSLMVLRASPASGLTAVLTSDFGGAAAAATINQLSVYTSQAMVVSGMIIGKVAGTAQVYSATFTAQLINNGGTTTLGAAVTLTNVLDNITLTTAPTVTANSGLGTLAVTSGAKTATVIRWVCTVQSCEITY